MDRIGSIIGGAEKEREIDYRMKTDIEKYMQQCTLCPRNCGVNRSRGEFGYCGADAGIKAARAALHMWEEPCISGKEGSGTVFFSGCSMRCVFCQNHDIALGRTGMEIGEERLAEIFLELQEKGANNINLVTPTHYVPQIVNALAEAKRRGLHLPIVYNTGSYDKVETIRLLEGLVDIYLPDCKYYAQDIGKRYSNVSDYFQVATDAIAEMYRQVGKPEFDERGRMKKGVIVRHLVLPGQTMDSKKIIQYLYENYKDNIFISIMNQYTVMDGLDAYPELQRKVTDEEYDEVVDYAIQIGVENGFIQEGETASESFIPSFTCEGILPPSQED